MRLTHKPRLELVRMLTTAADAAEAHLSDTKLMVKGRPWTPRELAALFRAHAREHQEVRTMYAAWLQKVRALRKELASTVSPAMATLRMQADLTLGATSVAYKAFGFPTPKKRGPKTIQAKAAAVDKAAATRKARGTLGKQQRRAARAASRRVG